MNLNQRMRKAAVYFLEETETSSGALKKEWTEQEKKIDIAIFYVDETSDREPFRYKQTTHLGLSYSNIMMKGEERGLLLNGVKYKVLAANPQGRLYRYLLEEMKLW